MNKTAKSGIFECAVVECTVINLKVIIISSYRSAFKGSLEEIHEYLEQPLEKLILEKELIFIAGNLNIELKDNIAEINLLLNSYTFNFTINQDTN